VEWVRWSDRQVVVVTYFESVVEAIKSLSLDWRVCCDDRERVAVRAKGQPLDALWESRDPTGFAPYRKDEGLSMAGCIIIGEEGYSVAVG
jgi:hypothetical protein